MTKNKERYHKIAEDSKMEILTIDQVAQFLKVNRKTIFKLVSNKREPGKIYAKKVGRAWRIQKKDIIKYLDQKNS